MKTLFLTTAVLAALSHVAWAAEPGTQVSELVVVATRTPQPLNRIGQQVTVIDQAELTNRQVVVLSDILSQTPGVGVSRNGGPGGTTSLRIRGAETDQTVLLIDGVKLNDPSAVGGGYNFANLLAGDIARVEVLRGAQSTLWGSQAIGGVVNVVTAEPSSPFEASASLEAGSMATAYGRLMVGGKSERLVWGLSGGYYTTDGVSAFRRGYEDDGYQNSGLNGRARVTIIDNVSLDLRAVYSKGRTQFDGFPPPTYSFADDAEFGRTETLVGYAGLNFTLADGRLKNRVAYGYTSTNSNFYDPTQAVTPLTFQSVGRNRRWEYQGVLALPGETEATFGVESERSTSRNAYPRSYDPSPIADRARTGIDSLYVQVLGQLAPGFSLTVGARHDRHETFGDHNLGQVAAAWKLNDGATILRASFAQGFKAPSLYQLYSPYGNTKLAPEAADSWDAGIEQHLGQATISLTGFARRTTDQIDFVSCTFGSAVPLCRPAGIGRFGYYDNIARTKAHGIEFVAKTQVAGVALDANYTWTKAENDISGKRLARRPEHMANAGAAYVWSHGLTTSLGVSYVGESFDNAANTRRLKSYLLTDVRASLPINDRLEIYGRIENAFDKRYETTSNYGSTRRGAYIGLRSKF